MMRIRAGREFRERSTIIFGINPSRGGRPLSERIEGNKMYWCLWVTGLWVFLSELTPPLNAPSIIGREIRI